MVIDHSFWLCVAFWSSDWPIGALIDSFSPNCLWILVNLPKRLPFWELNWFSAWANTVWLMGHLFRSRLDDIAAKVSWTPFDHLTAGYGSVVAASGLQCVMRQESHGLHVERTSIFRLPSASSREQVPGRHELWRRGTCWEYVLALVFD